MTGATGLIGSSLVHYLLKNSNAHVIALSRSESKLKKIFSQYTREDSFEYVAQDVCELSDLRAISQKTRKCPVDAIFHAASSISMGAIQKYPLDIINPNLFATQRLLEGLVKQQDETGLNNRIVIFSSATVYGQATKSDIIVSEADTMHAYELESANAPYSESKRMAEVITLGYSKQYGVDAVIARPSYVYGSAFFPPETSMYEFILNAISGQNIYLNHSNLGRRDNIYLDDAVSGLIAVFDKGKSGEAYNISSGGERGNFAAIDEIAEIICKVTNEELSNKINVCYKTPKSLSRKPGIILDSSKLKTLGWKVETSLADGIRSTILQQFAKL